MTCTLHVAWDGRLAHYDLGPGHPMAPGDHGHPQRRVPAERPHAVPLGLLLARPLASFLPPMDLECRIHVELPVHALLSWPEVAGRLRHGD